MKKIWVLGISKDFDLGGNVGLHKFYAKYEPLSTIPTKEIDIDTIDTSCSFWMFDYMPDGFMERFNEKKYSGFHMEYTNNEEKIKKEWYAGILSHYKHLKWLEDGQLLTMDKRTIRPMKRIVKEANEHREKFPELWL